MMIHDQKSFLELAVIWKDEDMIELRVTAANANFYGKVQVYCQPDRLSQFASSILHSSLNEMNLFYESGNKDGYAYFSMKYYSIGFTGNIGVEINFEGNVPTDYRPEERDKMRLEIIIEPNQLDIFQRELYELAKTEDGKATLYGGDNLPKNKS
jgi:hypothetical protein